MNNGFDSKICFSLVDMVSYMDYKPDNKWQTLQKHFRFHKSFVIALL